MKTTENSLGLKIPTDRLLDANDWAEILGVEPRTVLEVYAKSPDFPAPVLLPTGKKGNARRRWTPHAAINYIQSRMVRS